MFQPIITHGVLIYLDSEILSAQWNTNFDQGQRRARLVHLYCSSHGILTENTESEKQVRRPMRNSNKCPVFNSACLILYLEELKEHMVEMWWHIYNLDGLARDFGCETFQNIDHKKTQKTLFKCIITVTDI